MPRATDGSSGNIFLVGLMGAGKTSVGKLLARRLGKTFYDCDHEIERATGVRIPRHIRNRRRSGVSRARAPDARRARAALRRSCSRPAAARCSPSENRGAPAGERHRRLPVRVAARPVAAHASRPQPAAPADRESAREADRALQRARSALPRSRRPRRGHRQPEPERARAPARAEARAARSGAAPRRRRSRAAGAKTCAP